MAFVEDDEVLQALSADAYVLAVGIWVLTGAMWGSEYFLDSYVFHSLSKVIAVYGGHGRA